MYRSLFGNDGLTSTRWKRRSTPGSCAVFTAADVAVGQSASSRLPHGARHKTHVACHGAEMVRLQLSWHLLAKGLMTVGQTHGEVE